MTASLLITPDCLATAWMPHQRRTVSVRLPCSATTKPTILGCSEWSEDGQSRRAWHQGVLVVQDHGSGRWRCRGTPQAPLA
jgi:hypothetical protein